MNEITAKERAAMALIAGVSEQYLYQCLTGRRDMNPAEAVRVERETLGRLTRQQLCQRSWRGIWPELAEQTAGSAGPATEPGALAEGAANG